LNLNIGYKNQIIYIYIHTGRRLNRNAHTTYDPQRISARRHGGHAPRPSAPASAAQAGAATAAHKNKERIRISLSLRRKIKTNPENRTEDEEQGED
jgi:hypothetical protein